MNAETAKTMATDNDIEEWLEARKREALKIDPETAEVEWCYVQVLDPYGVYPNLPEECQQTGRESFARRPGGDIWVCFDDLPDQTRNRLEELHGWRLHFPSGVPYFGGNNW